jgi:type IV pilus assembly protein PilM
MPLSLFRKSATIGVDIGQFAIRLAEVVPDGSNWRIAKYAWAPTPKDTVRDGVVLDAQAVGLAIKQLLREGHFSADTASLAVGGGSVIVRAVRMPQMSQATLRKSIRFEAGRYVPTSIEDSYIEFEILGHTEDSQMDVLMVAAPKDIVNSRVAACEQAGLTAESVDVEVFAAYRALVETDSSGTWHEKTVALVDIGASKTNMAVIRRGQFVMTRSLPHGGQLLTDALKQYFKLSHEEAEEGKSQLDLSCLVTEHGPQENPPLRVVQPHVDDLIREIRRSLNYYQSQLAEGEQSKNIDVLLLAGGGSKLKGLAAYSHHKLKLEAYSAGVLSSPNFNCDFDSSDEGNDLAVVAGLALRASGDMLLRTETPYAFY